MTYVAECMTWIVFAAMCGETVGQAVHALANVGKPRDR